MDRGVRLFQYAAGEFKKMTPHALDLLFAEQIDVVIDSQAEAVRRFGEIEEQVELGGIKAAFKRHADRLAELKRLFSLVLQGDHRVNERRTAGVAFHAQVIYQAIKRIGLVGYRLRDGLLYLVQHIGEPILAAKPIAQHQRVDVKADLRLQVGMIAARDGRPHQQIFLAGVAIKQNLHQGREGHEETRA